MTASVPSHKGWDTRKRVSEGIYFRQRSDGGEYIYDIQFRVGGRQVWRSFWSQKDAEEFRRAVKNGEANEATPTTGVRSRHARWCRRGMGQACDCSPSYEAFVYRAATKSKCRRTFPTLEEALAWRESLRDGGINPLSEFVVLANARIRQMERELGEALPHLILAREYLAHLHAQAERDAEFLWSGA